jgi:dephospho-CoA kinase
MSLVIGLTGGIGSGKSTVVRMFEALGATAIDADAIVRELQAPGSELLDEIAAAFGAELIRADGRLDRKALATIVFRDDAARERLNAIMHPAVASEFARRVEAARAGGEPLIVLDIPLLFEGRASGDGTAARVDFDATVVVFVTEEQQIERQMLRDGSSREEAELRVRAQLPLDAKRALADFTIDNSGSREQTERQVREVVRAISAARP